MNKLLVVGGSRGIGAEILKQNLGAFDCINISRTEADFFSSGVTHYSCDIIEGDLPDLHDINALVYCPGSINLKPINSLQEGDFVDDFNINVLGAVKVIRKYLRPLKRNKGSIVLFGTVAVVQGMPFHSSIAVAKAGVQALSRTLAAELAPSIRVNCIAPSITDTSLAASILRNEKSRENIAERHPLKSIMNPEDIASMASYLISEKAKNITGQVIGIDGGMSTLKI
jgi:NAD(P)-dependent dehydrogenase (short-subunit alcohol dehydrogenase family)